MTDRNDSVVAEYLARVTRATAGLPADQRDELVRDLLEHIEGSRADLPVETEAQVRGILERLGDPAVIARAAAEEAGLPPAPAEMPRAVDERPMVGSRRRLGLWLIAAIVIVLLVLGVVVLYFAQDPGGGSAMSLPTGHVATDTWDDFAVFALQSPQQPVGDRMQRMGPLLH